MRRALATSVLAAALAGVTGPLGARGQDLLPARDAPAPRPEGAGVVDGAVVSDDASAVPIRRAVVTLNGSGIAETTVASDEGRFTFSDLPAGRYQVAASKAAYLTMAYGAARPGRAGTPVVLAAGQRRSDLVIRLPRGAVITGQVRDQFGEPAAHRNVFAMQTRWKEGRQILVPVSVGSAQVTTASAAVGYRAAMTDDRGIYRLYGLAPGEYLVVVAQLQSPSPAPRHQTTADDIARAEALIQASQHRVAAGAPGTYRGLPVAPSPSSPAAQGEATSFAPVYYPGTLVAGSARTVTLAIGEEREGIDVPLQLASTATVRGTLTDRAGRPARNVMVQLVSTDAEVGAPQAYGDARPASGGFSLMGVAPGNYRLEARTLPAQGESAQWADQDLRIDGRDVTDLALVLQPGVTLRGRVAFAGSAGHVAPTVSATVTLVPEHPLSGSWTRPLTATSKDGTFAVEGVTPGMYRVSASLAGPATSAESAQWWFASATIAGRDVADAFVDVRPGEALDEIVVRFDDRPATLSGSVQDAAGRPVSGLSVVAFSTNRADWHWHSRRIREVRLANDGTYGFAALPPGEYWLVVLNDVEPDEWFDPTFLASSVSQSIKVTVLPGQQTAQTVRIVGG